ncbi:hypothetical protein QOT17_004242 [Balamuthia mandrillaris]
MWQRKWKEEIKQGMFACCLQMIWQWASDPFELQRRLNVAVEAKSVVLVQGKKACFQEWRLKGEAMKCVKKAKYLGLWFEENGEWTTHAKERIKAKQALYSLRQQGAIAQGLGTYFPDYCRGHCQVYFVIWTLHDRAFQIMVEED